MTKEELIEQNEHLISCVRVLLFNMEKIQPYINTASLDTLFNYGTAIKSTRDLMRQLRIKLIEEQNK